MSSEGVVHLSPETRRTNAEEVLELVRSKRLALLSDVNGMPEDAVADVRRNLIALLSANDLWKADLGACLDLVDRDLAKKAGVEPMAQPGSLRHVVRSDEVRPGLDHGAIMENAPDTVQDQFKVPRIVE